MNAAPKAPEPVVGELWAMLTALPRPHRIIDYPRNMPGTETPIGQVAIQVLTQAEQMAATAETERYVKALMKDPTANASSIGYAVMFDNESSVRIVVRAVRDAKDPKKQVFPSAELMRAKLSTTEIGALMSAYIDVQRQFGPIISTMSEAEMEAWIVRIAEDATKSVPLYLVSPEQRVDLLHYSACLISKLRTGMSSAGSPPDDPTTNSEPLEAVPDLEP